MCSTYTCQKTWCRWFRPEKWSSKRQQKPHHPSLRHFRRRQSNFWHTWESSTVHTNSTSEPAFLLMFRRLRAQATQSPLRVSKALFREECVCQIKTYNRRRIAGRKELQLNNGTWLLSRRKTWFRKTKEWRLSMVLSTLLKKIAICTPKAEWQEWCIAERDQLQKWRRGRRWYPNH